MAGIIESQRSISPKISRRTFFTNSAKMSMAAGILSVLPSDIDQNSPEISDFVAEPENMTFLQNTALIDFGFPIAGETYQQRTTTSTIRVFGELLQNSEISLGQRARVIALLTAGFSVFSDHSIHTVIPVLNHVLVPRHYNTIPNIIPIQESIDITDSNMNYTDRLGNRGIQLSLKAQPLIELLQDYDEKVVNISFQLGKLKLLQADRRVADFNTLLASAFGNGNSVDDRSTKETFDQLQANDSKKDYLKKYIKIKTENDLFDTGCRFVGGYSGEDAQNNIQEMFALSRAFPDKLFCVAIGNYCDDIRELREKLKDEWPENILFIGQWDAANNKPTGRKGDSHGADIYVDNLALGLKFALEFSSPSTASISACATIFAQYYDNPAEIKQKLLEICDMAYYTPDPEGMLQYDGYNLGQVIEAYINPQKIPVKIFNFEIFDQEIDEIKITA